MKRVVIVDYGMGNIKSVQRGLEKIGATAELSSNAEAIAKADYLVLPGVGAFADGMAGIIGAGLLDAILSFAKTGNPLMGICLGMQMLLEESQEYGVHKGLGLIPGNVTAIPQKDGENFLRKTPHIGWNSLKPTAAGEEWQRTCLLDTEPGEFFYFVHSFMAQPTDASNLLAQCEYEGFMVTAAIQKENVTGLQFHPEKSGAAGLKILKQFVAQ